MERLQGRTARWVGGTIGVCLVLMAATWFGLIAPRRGEIASVRSENATAISANNALRTRLDQLRAQYRQLPDITAQLQQIHEQLPPDTDMPSVVKALSDLADSTGVSLDSITPSTAEVVGAKETPAAQSSDGLFAVPMTVVVSGGYFQAVAFLRELQTGLPRAFLVSSLQIDRLGSGGGSSDGAAPGDGPSSGTDGTGGTDTDPTASPGPTPTGTDGSQDDAVLVTIGGKIFTLVDPAKAAKATAGGPAGAATGTASGTTGGTPPGAATQPTAPGTGPDRTPAPAAPTSAPAVAAATVPAATVPATVPAATVPAHRGGSQW